MKDSGQLINFTFFTGDYFADYMSLLDKYKLKYQRITVESENPVEKNSIYIKKALDKIKGKILVISHSKGGLEFLDLLIKYPEVKSRLVGWISMQSPYRGSVLADYFLEGSVTNTLMSWVFSMLGGDVTGLESVGTKVRGNYVESHKSEIKSLFDNINFLQFLTFINDQKGRETVLEFSRDYIRDRVGRNDGMVDIKSALFESQRYIIINGVDHLSTILDQKNMDFLKDDNPNSSFNRMAHFRALLQIILE